MWILRRGGIGGYQRSSVLGGPPLNSYQVVGRVLRIRYITPTKIRFMKSVTFIVVARAAPAQTQGLTSSSGTTK